MISFSASAAFAALQDWLISSGSYFMSAELGDAQEERTERQKLYDAANDKFSDEELQFLMANARERDMLKADFRSSIREIVRTSNIVSLGEEKFIAPVIAYLIENELIIRPFAQKEGLQAIGDIA